MNGPDLAQRQVICPIRAAHFTNGLRTKLELPTTARNRHLLLSDLLLLTAAPALAYALRFEGWTWDLRDTETARWYIALAVPIKLLTLYAFGLYGRLWRRASIPDLAGILQATLAGSVICIIIGVFALPLSGLTPLRVPISIVFLDAFLTVAAVATPRLLLRIWPEWRSRRINGNGRRALIVGAGATGAMILKELRSNPQLGLTPIGFVDDDPNKQRHRLHDLPVLGSLADTRAIIVRERVGEVVIAIPSASGTVLRSVVRAALDANVPARTVPALGDILSGRLRVTSLRNVELHDLLRREPVWTDLAAVRAIVGGQVVLITGAGGSIGSELARQLAQLQPSRLVLLGNGENEIFDIELELRDTHPRVELSSVIGDIRDEVRMKALFERFRPHAVFHAAAHKHVPLMEENIAEAVTNNVLGTRRLLECAASGETQHFVLISTDKAVRPTSVMGATKRIAEMLVQHAARATGRNFVSVRFGNVLGSRSSVVPIFLRQIQSGGPLTITHPEMRRYFMTIPEAVQLVLQAAALGRGGEVLVLDMGEPIKIIDLANDLIRLSGLKAGKDIEIRYTGVRPGERLYEERFYRGEDALPSAHPKILRATNNHLGPDVSADIELLINAARHSCPDDDLRNRLSGLIAEFPRVRGAGRGQSAPAPAPAAKRRWSRPDIDLFQERRSGLERRHGQRRRAAADDLQIERRGRGDRRSAIDRRAETVTPRNPVSATGASPSHTVDRPGVRPVRSKS